MQKTVDRHKVSLDERVIRLKIVFIRIYIESRSKIFDTTFIFCNKERFILLPLVYFDFPLTIIGGALRNINENLGKSI